jgi:AraC-like DNA-binding protein
VFDERVCYLEGSSGYLLVTNAPQLWSENHVTEDTWPSPKYPGRLVVNRLLISLRRERTHHAQMRLLESDDLGKEIAEQCGYTDSHHSGRNLKRFAGVPPTRSRLRERPLLRGSRR